MSRDLKELEREILELALDVAERRQREIQRGFVQEVAADEVLRRARAAIS